MLALFRVLVDRLQALLRSDAALDLEAPLLTRAAERKADLLRQAAAREAEGLETLAAELRRQAAAQDLARPLAVASGVLAIADGQGTAPALRARAAGGTSREDALPPLPSEPAIESTTARRCRRGRV